MDATTKSVLSETCIGKLCKATTDDFANVDGNRYMNKNLICVIPTNPSTDDVLSLVLLAWLSLKPVVVITVPTEKNENRSSVDDIIAHMDMVNLVGTSNAENRELIRVGLCSDQKINGMWASDTVYSKILCTHWEYLFDDIDTVETFCTDFGMHLRAMASDNPRLTVRECIDKILINIREYGLLPRKLIRHIGERWCDVDKLFRGIPRGIHVKPTV